MYCYSLGIHQKENIKFNLETVYVTLAEHMLCDKEKLVEQIKLLADSEEAKIIEPIERWKYIEYLFILFMYSFT